jgi:hypothetical protein
MQKLLLPFFLVGTVVMMLVMAKTGSTLKTPDTPLGIIDLEFAHNIHKVKSVLAAWAPTPELDNIKLAKINTWWDFIFLFFYSGFLFLTCKKMAVKIKGPVAIAGKMIAKGALLAGFLDILENAGMLLTLNDHSSSTIAFATTFVSVVKWGLAAIAVLYVLTGLIVFTFRKKQRQGVKNAAP